MSSLRPGARQTEQTPRRTAAQAVGPKPPPQQRSNAGKATPQQQQQQRRVQQKRVAPRPKVIPKITSVQIEGLVLLKIIKHCGEYLSEQQAVSGKLLGLPTNHHTVEVTNSFPMPNTQFSGDNDESSESSRKHMRAHKKANKYAQDMIRLMRRVREDDLGVGFYRSALNGAFVKSDTIEAQYMHQLQSASSVCVIYDPTASVRGRLVVRAFRLADSFMKFYAKKEFGPTAVAKHALSSENIFEELDVKIHNSHLVHAFLYEIAQLPPQRSLTNGYDRLHHAHHDSLVSNYKQLSTAIDGYAEQTQHFRGYYSKCMRTKTAREEFMAKFREQNMQLKSRGQKAKQVPNLDKQFAPDKEPDRIEAVTLTAQMDEYCQDVDTSVMQALVKLWVTQGIHCDTVIQ